MWILWLLPIILLFFRIRFKVQNYNDDTQLELQFIGLKISFNYEKILNKFKELARKNTNNLIDNLRRIKNFFSLHKIYKKLLKRIVVDSVVIKKYINYQNPFYAYTTITFNLFTSYFDVWIKDNTKAVKRIEYEVESKGDREDYDFIFVFSISLFEVLIVVISSFADLFRYIKKERLINGS